MKIRDREEQKLFMDFINIDVPCGSPSDIDLWYLTSDDFLIIGEIKNRKGEFKTGQKYLLERLIDGHKDGGAILYITHDKDVHRGDERVDVARCQVDEYYFKGKWRKPKRRITVNEAFDIMMGGFANDNVHSKNESK